MTAGRPRGRSGIGARALGELAPGILPAAALLAIYRLTMPSSLTWAHWGADGGDLATAVALGRLPHPPGFPSYLLLGAAFVRLLGGDPAGRLNLLSALAAALAAGLTAAAVRRASSSFFAAVVAGLSLGLAPLFWSQALIAEVYAPAALFAAALLFLALQGAPAGLRGAVWGLGLGVHPTLLFLAPLAMGGSHRSDRGGLWVSLRPALFALLAAGALYGPVLWIWGKAPSPWADVSTPDGWWAYVSGRLYHGYLFALPAALWPRRLLAWVGLLARQFTPVGALLALGGWGRLGRADRGLALSSALAFGGFSLYAIGYHTADSLVYLVPALPVAAFWLGLGLSQVADRLRARRPLALGLLWGLPLLQLVLFWSSVDVRDDRSALRWAEAVLAAAPPRAVLLTGRDAHTFTLWYVRDVLGVRPDVRIVDRDLLAHPPYRRFLGIEWGEEPPAGLEAILRDPTRPVIPVDASSSSTG